MRIGFLLAFILAASVTAAPLFNQSLCFRPHNLSALICQGYVPLSISPSCNPITRSLACTGGYFSNPDSPYGLEPCCEGFFCPADWDCMIPCAAGAFCPTGTFVNSSNSCYPYKQTPLPLQDLLNNGCGGADVNFICPQGYYCPNTSSQFICPSGYFCREGSTQPDKCPLLTICKEGTSLPTSNFAGVIGLTILFIVLALLLVFWEIIRKACRQWRRERYVKKREARLSHMALIDIDERKDRISEDIKNKDSINPFKQRSTKINITLKDVQYTLGKKSILLSVNGTFKAGRVTAVMGPSGAGKSSLLSVITGKLPNGAVIKGDILFNSTKCDLTQFKKLSGISVGYVPQNDIMLPELTVEECLRFIANYRLHKNMSLQQKRDVVRYVLRLLGLEFVRDDLIGDEVKRGISGGQKKRVNIGMELVSDPSLLFLDEPTSGLDSTTSKEVMDVLKKISHLGTNIIVVLHQPRFEIFEMFDDVMLLAKGGKTVYFGPTSEVLPYFENHLGFVLPSKVNPADFFMDVIAGEVKCNAPFDSSIQEYLCNKWKKYQELHSQQTVIIDDNSFASTSGINVAPGFFEQTYNCFHRTCLQIVRNIRTELSDLFLIMLAGVAVGFMFRAPKIIDIARTNSMVVLSVTIVGMQQSLRLFGAERVVYWRECSSDLNRLAYFTGKTLASLVYLLIMPLVYLGMFYGFNAPRAKVEWYYGVLVAGYYASQGCGHFVSTLMEPAKAQLCAVVLSLILCLVNGFSPTIPELDDMGFAGTLAYSIAFTRYQQEAFFLCDTNGLNPVFQYQVEELYKLFGYQKHGIPLCVSVIIVIGTIFRILTFAALKHTNKDKQK